MRSLVTRHMHDVAKSARGYHARIGALALDHHICRHCGAVQHNVDVSRRYSGDLAYFHHALDDADRLIRRGRRYFVYENFLTRADGRLLQDNVRKRAPNINADTYHDLPHSFIASARPAGAEMRFHGRRLLLSASAKEISRPSGPE